MGVTIHTPTKLKMVRIDKSLLKPKVGRIPIPFEFDKTIGVEDTNDLYLIKKYGDKKNSVKIRYKDLLLLI